MSQAFHVGDPVIYSKTKHSVCPGPRAKNVAPASLGDTYSYQVDKFWTVGQITDGLVLLVTRRGKKHRVAAADPNLRHAAWWERWWYKNRFPSTEEIATNNAAIEDDAPVREAARS